MRDSMNAAIMSQLDSFGHYVPLNRVANAQFEDHFDLEYGWIEKRTGIKARHWAAPNELLVDLAEKAGVEALKNSVVAKQEISLLILATSTPDHLLPPTSPLLAYRLGLPSSCCTYDLSGACSGFLNALLMADGFVRTQKKSALVIAANILSRRINQSDCQTAPLFGDAAGAVIIKPATNPSIGILGMYFLADGSAYDLISISSGGSQQPFAPETPLHDYKIRMNDGPSVFANAINMMTECSLHALKQANLTVDDIDTFIPHQANVRMTLNTAKKLGIHADKTISIVQEYANASAAGIPLALSMANQHKAFMAGDKILLTTVGAGMSAGSIILGI